MIVVLMGVSGSGKTTLGRVLADDLGWPFRDADELHPPANIDKMSRGVPLTDDDRRPWLRTLAVLIDEVRDRGGDLVLACSAVKRAYRDTLRDGPDVRYVYLHGSADLIRERLARRSGHYMDPDLLRSQFDALELPEAAIQVDIAPPPAEIAAEIRRQLGL